MICNKEKKQPRSTDSLTLSKSRFVFVTLNLFVSPFVFFLIALKLSDTFKQRLKTIKIVQYKIMNKNKKTRSRGQLVFPMGIVNKPFAIRFSS